MSAHGKLCAHFLLFGISHDCDMYFKKIAQKIINLS